MNTLIERRIRMRTSLQRFVFSIITMTLLLAACGSSLNNVKKEELFENVHNQLNTLWNKEQDDLAENVTVDQIDDVRNAFEEELQQKEIQKSLNPEDDEQIDNIHHQLDLLTAFVTFEEKVEKTAQQQKKVNAKRIQELSSELEQFESYKGYYERQQQAIQHLESQLVKNEINTIEKNIQQLYDDHEQIKLDLKKADFEDIHKLIGQVDDQEIQESLTTQVNEAEEAWTTALAQKKAAEEKLAAEQQAKKEQEEKQVQEAQRLAEEATKKQEQAQATEKKETTEKKPHKPAAKKEATEKKQAPKSDTTQSNKKTDQPKEQTKPKKENNKQEQPAKTVKPKYVGNGVIIASKKYPLPANHAPGESGAARAAFNKMAAAAKNEGIHLTAFSTYRSYDYQVDLYNRYVARDGQAAADRYSAKPGHSEHQTGLAFDIGEVGQEQHFASSSFANTKGGKWLAKNAHNYGFILRYPQGKEGITGYMYESWHYRYVGNDLAKKIHNKNSTLEEYFGI